MRGQFRPREAIIGRWKRAKNLKNEIFFLKTPDFGTPISVTFRMIFRIFFDPKQVTNLKFNLSQKKFEKIHVQKFPSRIKIENFQFLKSNF